jgi:aryl-alcohol dehydrogenase-like predicted oxidoreductase
MQTRRLGQSDLEVTRIIFGAWGIGGWMWGKQDRDDAIAAIRSAVEVGMTSIDTAAIYGFGRSEQLVAEALKDIPREKVQILTKYGLRWDSEEGEFFIESEDVDGTKHRIYRNARPESVIHECEQSLRRLKTDYIDLYQCHWRDHTTPVEDTMEAIRKLLEQGKIRAAGVSNFNTDELATAGECVPLASDQPPYNMVRRDIEDDVLPWCRRHNVGVIVYSPMQRGLLTGKFKPGHEFDPGDNRADNPLFQGEKLKRVNAFLDEIRPIAEAHDATLAQLAVNWTLQADGVSGALVGARNPEQARENAKAGAFDITEDELATINAALARLEDDLEQME